MNPAPLPVARFNLVIAPRHDGLSPRPNVVETLGAVSRLSDELLHEAIGRLRAHPKFRSDLDTRSAGRRVISVFLGGDTEEYELTAAFAESLVKQVVSVCEALDVYCLVTTSRRTKPAVERLISERLAKHPRCQLLLIASRDPIDATMEGMLGCANVAVVTGESISMVSESCASGRPVIVVEPSLRQVKRNTLTKHQRFLHELEREGYVRIGLIPEVAHTLTRLLRDARPARRLNSFEPIQKAVARLI